MAVVASFKTDLTFTRTFNGNLTVNFTDTSTGSPTNWFWNFGDGNSSINQNPSHTYTSSGSYTVQLQAWIETGSTDVFGSLVNKEKKIGIHSSNYDTAYANFLADSWTLNANTGQRFLARHQVNGQKEVEGGRGDLNFDLTSHSGKIIILYVQYTDLTGEAESSAILNGEDVFPNPSDNLLVPFKNISSEGGGNYTANFIDNNNYAKLTVPSFGKVDGWSIEGTTVAKASSYSSSDVISKVINVTGSKIDFVGTPLSGTAPLNVQFTDLSGVEAASSTWNFGNGISVTVAGSTNPVTTYTAIC